MAWYRREDYAQLRAVAADGERLPASFDAWARSAEQVAGEVERSGVAVRRVLVDPAAFAAWCEGQGVPANAAARSRFAQEHAGRDGAGAEAVRPPDPATRRP